MRWDAGVVALAASGCAFLLGLGAAVALALPQMSVSPLSGLSPAREARAHAILQDADRSPAALERATSETWASLREAPANPRAWLRLAYIDALDPEGFGPNGNLALSRSWSVAPLGPDDTPWRLAFALNHWAELTPANRRLALDELEWALARRSSGPALREALEGSVTDPAGRLALRLTSELGPAAPQSPIGLASHGRAAVAPLRP